MAGEVECGADFLYYSVSNRPSPESGRSGVPAMRDFTGEVHRQYRQAVARSAALRRRVERLQIQIAENTRRIRRVMDSRRPIAGGRGWGQVMDLTVEEGAAVCLIHVSGDIDLLSMRDLQNALERMDAGPRPVVLSLRDVHYIDCSAVHVLEAECARLEQRGRRLVVIDATPMIRKIFEVVNPTLPVFPSLDAALRYLKNEPAGRRPNLRAS